MTAIDIRQHLHQQVDRLSLPELQLLALLTDRLFTTSHSLDVTGHPIPELPDLLNWLHQYQADMISPDAPSNAYSTLESSRLITDLGWTAAQTTETYHRLQSFQDDWEAPGMEVYDQL